MEFIECCVDGNVYIPHAICNGQILSAASSIDMIDSSPGGYRRVSMCIKQSKPLSQSGLNRLLAVLSLLLNRDGDEGEESFNIVIKVIIAAILI